mgnify:CR=1 FL=1
MVKETEIAVKEDVVPATAAEINSQFSKTRSKGEAIESVLVHDPKFPWPELNPARVGPSAYAAVIDKKGEKSEDIEFHLNPEKMKGLPFAPAGRPIPSSKPLYTIKAVHTDGRLVQLPFEEQINNTAAGDHDDAIGLNRYARKVDAAGDVIMYLLIDLNTMIPVYCPARDCWAQRGDPSNRFFCCPQHLSVTIPGNFKGAKAEQYKGLMSGGVTTSRVWGG